MIGSYRSVMVYAAAIRWRSPGGFPTRRRAPRASPKVAPTWCVAHRAGPPKVNRVGDPLKSLVSSANTHSGTTAKTLLDAGSTMSMP